MKQPYSGYPPADAGAIGSALAPSDKRARFASAGLIVLMLILTGGAVEFWSWRAMLGRRHEALAAARYEIKLELAGQMVKSILGAVEDLRGKGIDESALQNARWFGPLHPETLRYRVGYRPGAEADLDETIRDSWLVMTEVLRLEAGFQLDAAEPLARKNEGIVRLMAEEKRCQFYYDRRELFDKVSYNRLHFSEIPTPLIQRFIKEGKLQSGDLP